MFAIGPYSINTPVVLAPMAGVSDRPFRQLCRQFGAGHAVSEMLSDNPRLLDTRKSRWRRDFRDEPAPVAVQIAGHDPALMAAAARSNVEAGADIIDINMGCPAKKVCRKAAGSALLRDPGLVREILQAVVAAVDVPVTLKIRTGWDPDTRNGPAIARLAEDAGIALLAVHGRTRACRFHAPVEYASIRAIKAAVGIPVLANGDIDSPQKAAAVLAETGADGVMIGRAAQGNPWLFRDIRHYLATGEPLPAPTHAEVFAVMRTHLAMLHAFYGEDTGVRMARKHIGWYFQRLGHNPGPFHRITQAAAQSRYLAACAAATTREDLAA